MNHIIFHKHLNFGAIAKGGGICQLIVVIEEVMGQLGGMMKNDFFQR